MIGAAELDALRRTTPNCLGLAWFEGSPLQTAASSGEPILAGWSAWDEVGKAAPALLHEGPVSCGEVLQRLPAAMLLLSARPSGVVAVLIELGKAGAGVALVQARVVASKVSP
jgi:hypothetical protein